MASDELRDPYTRDSRRVGLEAPVRLRFDRWREPLVGTALNLALDGMFVRADDPVPPGSPVDFELELGGPEPVRGSGEVVWVREQSCDPELPAGLALRFRDLDRQARERIFAAVDGR